MWCDAVHMAKAQRISGCEETKTCFVASRVKRASYLPGCGTGQNPADGHFPDGPHGGGAPAMKEIVEPYEPHASLGALEMLALFELPNETKRTHDRDVRRRRELRSIPILA